jgi:hypothetical protein
LSGEVTAAIGRLKFNKNNGGKGLSTNRFKLACDELAIDVALLFTDNLVHDTVPLDFLLSTALPIPKGRNVNLTDSANYRGIVLGSVFVGIFDLVVLQRTLLRPFRIVELQFRFKRNSSTQLVVNTAIAYYVNNNKPFHWVYLDAMKAFDEV